MKKILITICLLLLIIVIYFTGHPQLTPITIETQESVKVDYISDMPINTNDVAALPYQMPNRFTSTIPTELVTVKEPINTEKILFIGNSLSVGLDYVDDNKYNFIAKVSATITSTRNEGRYGDIEDVDFETVVIGFGTNELGAWTLDDWITEFEILLNQIYSKNQNASVIIMSPPPLSEVRSNRGDRINNENVKICTEYLKIVAEEFGVYFLDNAEFFGDTLDSNWTGDGVHLYGTVYKEWLDFIVEKLTKM